MPGLKLNHVSKRGHWRECPLFHPYAYYSKGILRTSNIFFSFFPGTCNLRNWKIAQSIDWLQIRISETDSCYYTKFVVNGILTTLDFQLTKQSKLDTDNHHNYKYNMAVFSKILNLGLKLCNSKNINHMLGMFGQLFVKFNLRQICREIRLMMAEWRINGQIIAKTFNDFCGYTTEASFWNWPFNAYFNNKDNWYRSI